MAIAERLKRAPNQPSASERHAPLRSKFLPHCRTIRKSICRTSHSCRRRSSGVSVSAKGSRREHGQVSQFLCKASEITALFRYPRIAHYLQRVDCQAFDTHPAKVLAPLHPQWAQQRVQQWLRQQQHHSKAVSIMPGMLRKYPWVLLIPSCSKHIRCDILPTFSFYGQTFGLKGCTYGGRRKPESIMKFWFCV